REVGLRLTHDRPESVEVIVSLIGAQNPAIAVAQDIESSFDETTSASELGHYCGERCRSCIGRQPAGRADAKPNRLTVDGRPVDDQGPEGTSRDLKGLSGR